VCGAHEAAWSGARVSVMATSNHTVYDGRNIPRSILKDSPPTGGKIVTWSRRMQGKLIEVDHVDIGTLADFDRSSITQSYDLCRQRRLLAHD
jgi:hypothetical protein